MIYVSTPLEKQEKLVLMKVRTSFFMPGEVTMPKNLHFDYYYGEESEQFSYYRIPRLLVTGDQFKRLSTDAKLLYGLLLDRMGLSAKNGWYDESGRVFIFYTLDEIQADLNCGHEKAVKLLSELDTKRGIGLIERMKQGQGRPTKIFVKRFTTRAIPPQSVEPQPVPRLPIIGSQDFGKTEAKSSEKQKSRLPVFGSADFGKSDGSYIESNQTDSSQLDPSIHLSVSGLDGGRLIDRNDCLEEVKENIEYEALCRQYIVEDIPTEQAQDRFQRLDYGHLEYVFDCLCRNTTQIRNIRAYLLTALYNAPTTISNYYQAAVQHDFGP